MISRCSIAATAFALACFAFASPAQISTIRFDGVYRALVQPPPDWPRKPTTDLFLYIRFYPDSSVVSVLSTATPNKVATFLRRHIELSGNGKYSISGDRVQFRVATRHGDIDYWGRIEPNSLQLSSYSHASHSRDTVRQYRFFPVRFAE
jgi:hypothetical protein